MTEDQIINENPSYPCPKCGEALTFENLYINLIIEIDIECPCCKNQYKGKALVNTKRFFSSNGNEGSKGGSKEKEGFKGNESSEQTDKVQEGLKENNRPKEVSNPKAIGKMLEKSTTQKTILAVLTIKENFIDEDGTSGGIGDVYPITKRQTVIGRKATSSTADIQIPSNRYMSRQHIVITNTDGQFHLKCDQPTNLPLVNGVKIPKEGSILLKNGDQITLGQCVAIWNQKSLDENKTVLL